MSLSGPGGLAIMNIRNQATFLVFNFLALFVLVVVSLLLGKIISEEL